MHTRHSESVSDPSPKARPKLVDRLHRALEALHLLLFHATDLETRRALVTCYRSLFDASYSSEEVVLNLRILKKRYALRMRKSDIFTLGEILHGGQYGVRSPLPSQPVILDAGANVGFSAAWFSALYEGAMVHCFEPEQENYRLLEANLEKLPGFVLNHCAVGQEEGLVSLRVADHGALHSVLDSEGNGPVQEVRQIALGNYLREQRLSQVDLLKLDVEGSELDALFGLGSEIEGVRVIIGELHRSAVDEHSFYEFLAQRGFRTVWTKDLPTEDEQEAVQLFEVANENASRADQTKPIRSPNAEP